MSGMSAAASLYNGGLSKTIAEETVLKQPPKRAAARSGHIAALRMRRGPVRCRLIPFRFHDDGRYQIGEAERKETGADQCDHKADAQQPDRDARPVCKTLAYSKHQPMAGTAERDMVVCPFFVSLGTVVVPVFASFSIG